MVALLLYILREVLGMVKMKRGLVRKAVIFFGWWWRVRFYGRLSLPLVDLWAGRGLYTLARMAGVRLVRDMVSGIRSIDFTNVNLCVFWGDGGGCGIEQLLVML